MARTRYRSSSGTLPLTALPAAALRAVLAEGYTLERLRADVVAGLVVGVVALPLAMALAIAVGVPPEHGLYTAIVAGLVAAALGGSRTQVTGPTAAFVVILAPIHEDFGLAGLLCAGLLAGCFLIAMGVARLGRLIEFVPYPVTTGFTAGIGLVIAVMQLEDLLGLEVAPHGHAFVNRLNALGRALPTWQATEFAIAGWTLLVLLGLPRLTRRVPAPIVALPSAAIVAELITWRWPRVEIATVARRFGTVVDGQFTGGIPQAPPVAILPWQIASHREALTLDWATVQDLVPAALAIAVLGAIESLLSAVVADGMAGTRHDPDAELIGQGLSNVVAPFFGGIASTGAIARTATNIRCGAQSPVAAMVHAVTVLAAVLALAQLLGHLPMAALAALLLVVAWNMSEAGHFVHMLRVAPTGDVAVLLTCFGLTVFFDMVIGVSVGVVLAAFIFMRRVAELTEVRIDGPDSKSSRLAPPGVTVYRISGPLFFGAAQKAMSTLEVVSNEERVVILDMSDVHSMDVTGLVALDSAIRALRARGRAVILCGLHGQAGGLLDKSGLSTSPGVGLAPTLEGALATATHLTSPQPPTLSD